MQVKAILNKFDGPFITNPRGSDKPKRTKNDYKFLNILIIFKYHRNIITAHGVKLYNGQKKKF